VLVASKSTTKKQTNKKTNFPPFKQFPKTQQTGISSPVSSLMKHYKKTNNYTQQITRNPLSKYTQSTDSKPTVDLHLTLSRVSQISIKDGAGKHSL
jgi:hypothetical protein